MFVYKRGNENKLNKPEGRNLFLENIKIIIVNRAPKSHSKLIIFKKTVHYNHEVYIQNNYLKSESKDLQ